jgi:hypothetical protein
VAHLARRLCIAAFGNAACRPQLPPVAANPLLCYIRCPLKPRQDPVGAFGILGEAHSSGERWITGGALQPSERTISG